MSVVAKDFLDFAKTCCGEQLEIHARNAIGRAYYACYHDCFEAIPEKYFSEVIDESAHNKLILAYVKYGNSLEPGRTVAKEISTMLGRLRAARVKADYKIDLDIKSATAIAELAYADVLFEKTAAFRSALQPKAAAQSSTS